MTTPTVDPENPNVIADYAPRAMAKPTASAPMTKLTDDEFEHFVRWLCSHTAFNRVGHAEALAAFKRAETETGFVVVHGGDR